ncbi:hypothetical protein NIES4073_71060 [Kalymmatonema gypsitolerans NIES-4073]|nr:hypothetical protein NIES4073_71060 [Scytonema sp. NIES-4073]
MSLAIINILNAGKIVKAAKGLWLVIQVGDVALSGYTLEEEIRKAIVGENYDPELNDLCHSVVEIGLKYDHTLAEIIDVNLGIENAIASIQNVHQITIDYERKQKLMLELVKNVSDLEKELTTIVPTTYNFFTEQFIQAKINDRKAKEDGLISLKAQFNRASPTWLLVVSGTAYSFLVAYMGYQVWSLGRRALPAPNSTSTRRVAPSEQEMSLLPQGLQLRGRSKSVGDVPKDQTPLVRPRERAESLGDVPKDQSPITARNEPGISETKRSKITAAVHVTAGALTVISFGMSISSLVNQRNERNHYIEQLKELRQRCQTEIPLYEAMLNGCKNEKGEIDNEKLNAVISLISKQPEKQQVDKESKEQQVDDETRNVLADGSKKVLSEHLSSLNEFINSMESVYEEIEKNIKIPLEKDNKSRLEELGIEQDLIIQQPFKDMEIKLKDGKKEFDTLKSNYENLTDIKDAPKKKNLIDKMIANFTKNVSSQLSMIISDLSQVRYYQVALKHLITIAQQLIDDAVEDQKNEITRKKIERSADNALAVINADREEPLDIKKDQIVKLLIHLINKDANDAMEKIPIVKNKVSEPDV